MTGTTSAQYQVLEKLGEGGMGFAYKARDTHPDRFVAINLLSAGCGALRTRWNKPEYLEATRISRRREAFI